MQYMRLCVCRLLFPFSMGVKIFVIHLIIIIIKSEIWIIGYNLRLGHETMVCGVCLAIAMFLLQKLLISSAQCNCFNDLCWTSVNECPSSFSHYLLGRAANWIVMSLTVIVFFFRWVCWLLRKSNVCFFWYIKKHSWFISISSLVSYIKLIKHV